MDPPRKSYFRLLLSNKTMPALVDSFAREGKDQVKILCQGQHRVHRDNQAGRKFLEHLIHIQSYRFIFKTLCLSSPFRFQRRRFRCLWGILSGSGIWTRLNLAKLILRTHFFLLDLYKWYRFGKRAVERNPDVSKTLLISVSFGREKEFFFLFYFSSLLEKAHH